MNEIPAKREDKILTSYIKSAVGTSAIVITIGCLGILCFGKTLLTNMLGITTEIDDSRLRTIMFAFFIYAILFNSFNTRSENANIFEHIGDNKRFIIIITALFVTQTIIIQFGGHVFGTVTLSAKEFTISFILGMIIIPIDLIRKAIMKTIKKQKQK